MDLHTRLNSKSSPVDLSANDPVGHSPKSSIEGKPVGGGHRGRWVLSPQAIRAWQIGIRQAVTALGFTSYRVNPGGLENRKRIESLPEVPSPAARV